MIWAQKGTLGIRDEGLDSGASEAPEASETDADTDTLHRAYRGNTGTGVRRTRAFVRGAAACCRGGQSSRRQQAADIQRQRSTCRRATSGLLAASVRRAAVFMSNTLTLEL
ncbi:hypothetical protein GCM10010497_45430 [Streptomyces cinereoruber]|uniref:Uncharacterized protein n=1 Tax=Streptomyces cinereoruber TaxID=67260 RepID=A0AAV4KPY5_9ACTN|nr:hypothetical protein GCM10010497_45430 [Streptomyces cinereoruber]